MTARPRTRRATTRRTAAAALAVASALTLAACTGLPSSGPVFPGLAAGAVAPPNFSFVPLKPQDGATPEQIVQGFIDAGIGADAGWEVAQLYLTASMREKWKPTTTTTVDDRALRAYTTSGRNHVSLTVTQRATVDDTGAYRPSDGGTSTLDFTLEKVSGQWRIAQAPDGIVLGADQFTGVFREYPLTYFDPSWSYLVPDVRWFAAGNAATRIAQSVIDGKPSPWLAGSVVSALPDSISLDPPSVPLSGGTAEVGLSGPVLSLDAQTLDRAKTQLVRSLGSAGAGDVEMTYQGASLDARLVSTASTRIDARALVRTESGFGFLGSTGQLESVGAVGTQIVRLDADAVDLSADHGTAAVRTASGAVIRVRESGEPATLDTRRGLIAPSLDPRGFVWSVPTSAPRSLAVYGPDGKRVSMDVGALSGASAVQALSVSRDGTRVAVLATIGGRPVVEAFGIVRGTGGAPTRLGDPAVLAALDGTGVDVTWLDDDTLGVLSHSPDGMVALAQTVGGPGSTTPAPDDAVSIAGSTSTTVRVRGADGTLYTQRGSNWEQAATHVLLLARSGGMP